MSQCSRVKLIGLHCYRQLSQVWSAQDNLQLAVQYSSYNSPQLRYTGAAKNSAFWGAVFFSIYVCINYLKLDDQ